MHSSENDIHITAYTGAVNQAQAVDVELWKHIYHVSMKPGQFYPSRFKHSADAYINMIYLALPKRTSLLATLNIFLSPLYSTLHELSRFTII